MKSSMGADLILRDAISPIPDDALCAFISYSKRCTFPKYGFAFGSHFSLCGNYLPFMTRSKQKKEWNNQIFLFIIVGSEFDAERFQTFFDVIT